MLHVIGNLYVRDLRRPLLLIAFFSAVANLMILSVPLHMMQVYGRILSSRSLETLIYITLITLVALVVYGVCEMVRLRLAQRLASRFLNWVSEPLLRNALKQTETTGRKTKTVRDIHLVQSYLSSKIFTSLFDLPFAPFFLLLIFLLHPMLGVLTVVGAVLLAGVSLLNHAALKKVQKEASDQQNYAASYLNFALQRNDEVLAMGLADSIFRRWGRIAVSAANSACQATDGNSAFFGISRTVRLSFQVSIMALGAWLVINNSLHPATIFAASLIAGKVLTPVEQLIGSWKQTLDAVSAFDDIMAGLKRAGERQEKQALPHVHGLVQVEGVSHCPDPINHPDRYTLRNISLEVRPGEAIAIVGPSGGGKSTLARVLTGIIEPCDGAVRLDGFELNHWNDAQRGAAVGFMPQDVLLFPGTIADNIARMEPKIDESKVIDAAHRANVHEMIGRLPDGYNTLVGPSGQILSGGQRQRIALARAFYGDPKILVLDEPNAHLDDTGQQALARAIIAAKEHQMTVIVISQRRSILNVVDRVIVLADGMIAAVHQVHDKKLVHTKNQR